jgi:hypothetical protein
MGGGMIYAQTNESTSSQWLKKSPFTSNLFVVIVISNPIPTSSDLISYGFFTTNKKSMILFRPPRGQSLCKVEMVNEKGKMLRKTKIAKEMESRFIDTTNILTYAQIQEKTRWKQLTPLTVEPYGEGGVGVGFYTPDQLFEINKPGKYMLKIQVQLLKRVQYRRAPEGSLMVAVTSQLVEIPIIKLDKSSASDK